MFRAHNNAGTSPYFGTQENIANAINDLGQVAGSSNREAFFSSESMGFIAIPGLDGFSTANNINNSGQIVGSSGTPGSGIDSFLWSQSTGTRGIGSFGGYYSSALGINNLGQVVGSSRNTNDVTRPFLWTENMRLIDHERFAAWVSGFTTRDRNRIFPESAN